jgi:hypothetical protein
MQLNSYDEEVSVMDHIRDDDNYKHHSLQQDYIEVYDPQNPTRKIPRLKK